MNEIAQSKILNITDQLAQAVNLIAQQIINKAPAAVNLLLKMAQLEALEKVIFFSLGIFGIFLILKISYFLLKKTEDEGLWLIIVIISFFIMLCLAFSILNNFDIFNFIGMFRPDIYLAHKMLIKINL